MGLFVLGGKTPAEALNLTTAARTAIVFPDGALVYDVDLDTLYVGDGATLGGIAVGGGTDDHTLLINIGTNTHAQIDTALTRLANTSGTNTGDQDLAGLVPYTGATGPVDLGANILTAESLQVGTSFPIKTGPNNSEIWLGNDAGLGATNANDSNFFGNSAGFEATDAQSSSFFGTNAGYNGTYAQSSNFFGNSAGYNGTYAQSSNFFGTNAGFEATNANDSNFFGNSAGYNGTDAQSSNFFGANAGYNGAYAQSSNFFGNSAGYNGTDANDSNFFGTNAGSGASSAANSIFIGSQSGASDTVDNVTNAGDWSIALGPYSGTGGFSNSMAFGRGVINTASGQFNFGNVLYGTGIYNSDTQDGAPIAGGKVGIGTGAPAAELDVVGEITTDAGTNKWKLKGLVTATVALDTTQHLEVEINGVNYLLALAV